MSALSTAQLHCEDAAFAYLEAKLWPHGSVCPHCSWLNTMHYDLSKTRRASASALRSSAASSSQ